MERRRQTPSSLPPEPEEIGAVTDELPGLLASLGLAEARVEHKGRAIGVHTRTLADPAQAFAALEPPIRELAGRYGLRVEPGKNVWEIRPAGVDKGASLRAVVAETGGATGGVRGRRPRRPAGLRGGPGAP